MMQSTEIEMVRFHVRWDLDEVTGLRPSRATFDGRPGYFSVFGVSTNVLELVGTDDPRLARVVDAECAGTAKDIIRRTRTVVVGSGIAEIPKPEDHPVEIIARFLGLEIVQGLAAAHVRAELAEFARFAS